MRTPNESPRPQGKITGLRTVLAAAILACTITGCKPDRAGLHIEIDDPVVNVELERLRRRFEAITQRTSNDTDEDRNERIAELLAERDQLLQRAGLEPGTERWYASGNNADGPYMLTRVKTEVCKASENCTVRTPQTPFPEVQEN